MDDTSEFETPAPTNAARPIRFGLVVLVASIALGAVPLIWGRSGINKYFVAFAFVGGCLGLLCILLGLLERFSKGAGPR